MFKHIVVVISLFSHLCWAQDNDVDYMAITALMLKNNYFSRAKESLNKIDLNEEDVDMHLYHSYKGIIYLHEKNYIEALNHLKLALTYDFSNTEIYLYLAEAYFQLKEYTSALESLNLIDKKVKTRTSYILLFSKINWALNKKELAYQILDSTDEKTAQTVLQKQKWMLLKDSELYQASWVQVQKYWYLWDEKTLLAYAANYRKDKQLDLALQLLERMRWQFPDSADTVMELAQVYIENKMTFSAASILEESARQIPEITYEAATMLRALGYARRALHLNMQVADEAKSLKNSLAIYLELENYQLVSQLEPQLEKVGLLKDEEMRYAVAFAHYKVGAFQRSESQLDQLSRPDLFKKAVEIKKLITNCKEHSWSCSETL
ncbi:MAG: tetratricopeptide repeat protein [Bdellovibrionales bacterium]|nr:tetratricopeptide repeat protein [Bdellovibrionales bacterium]